MGPDFLKIQAMIAEKREKFDALFRLLTEYNRRYNLTSITEEREVYYKHFVDSAAGEGYFSTAARVLEVGSGAGFPSLPLKLLRDDLSFTLVESTGKKCEFLKVAVKELGLDRVEILNVRAEAAGKEAKYREKYDVCCARAVARTATLSEYCLPFVRVGGCFLAYKGDAEEEVAEAERGIALLGGGKAEMIKYALPEGYGARALVKISKVKPTPMQYPRGRGKERSEPLI